MFSICQNPLQNLHKDALQLLTQLWLYFSKSVAMTRESPISLPPSQQPQLLLAAPSLLVGRALLQRRDGRKAYSCCIVGCSEAGNSV